MGVRNHCCWEDIYHRHYNYKAIRTPQIGTALGIKYTSSVVYITLLVHYVFCEQLQKTKAIIIMEHGAADKLHWYGKGLCILTDNNNYSCE